MCPRDSSCYPGCAEVDEVVLCGEALYTAVGWATALGLIAAAEGLTLAKLCETQGICIQNAPMTPKPKAQSKAESKTKAEAKTKAATATPIPCIPMGADKGEGRFKPARIPGFWVRCKYWCGGNDEKHTKYELFNPGVNDDCYDPRFIPTYIP